MRATATASLLLLTAACQPAVMHIEYDKDEPLYGTGDDDGGGGGGSGGGGSALEGELEMYYEGFSWSSGGDVTCEAWWSLTGTPASTECEYCDFQIDWAFDVTYELDEDALLLPSGCEYTLPGFYAGEGYYGYGEGMLETYFGTWAYTANYYGWPAFLLGYEDWYYGGTTFWPLYDAEVHVDSERVTWRYEFGYYGYYGYYDYAAAAYGYTQGIYGVGRFR